MSKIAGNPTNTPLYPSLATESEETSEVVPTNAPTAQGASEMVREAVRQSNAARMTGVVSSAPSPEAQARRAVAAAATYQTASGATIATSDASYDDKYWASQPPEVQQLRYIDDPDERWKIVGELMAKGYKIDVPIMVWGWNPSTTTALRQAYGYTWVPHAMQESIKIAPGLTMPGVEAYDPNNPPPDSIIVDTETVLPGIMIKDFDPGQLNQQFDRATFLNSRIQEANPPTTATVTSADRSATAPMRPELLSSLEQAVALQRRLEALGLKGLKVTEQLPAAKAQVDWAGESRRVYSLGGVNVGLMLNQLARIPTEQALLWIQEQIAEAAGARTA
jgi:hypothetical protein